MPKKSSSSIGPKSSSYKSSTSGYIYPPVSPHISSSYDSIPRREMRSLSGTSVNPKSSESLHMSSTPYIEPVVNQHVRRTKRAGCKGKKIVECNTTPGCRFTTGSKRNFCRTIKNSSKTVLGKEQLELFINDVSSRYSDEKRLPYVIERIRRTKCKFTAGYKGVFTGRKFTGPDKVYNQAMDKIEDFFKYGGDNSTLF